MTSRYGSIKKIPGCVYISDLSFYNRHWLKYSDKIEPYRFHVREGKVYYVNGRKQIFLLSCPSCQGLYCDIYDDVFKSQNLGPVLFTPISHLEYIFS